MELERQILETAQILAENYPMQRVAEKVGFRLHRAVDIVEAEMELMV